MKKRNVGVALCMLSALVLAAIVILYEFGLIGNNGIKIVKSIKYTIDESNMLRDFDMSNYIDNGKYHALINLTDDNSNASLDLRCDVDSTQDIYQITGSKKINILFTTMDCSFISQISKDYVRIKIPILANKVYEFRRNSDDEIKSVSAKQANIENLSENQRILVGQNKENGTGVRTEQTAFFESGKANEQDMAVGNDLMVQENVINKNMVTGSADILNFIGASTNIEKIGLKEKIQALRILKKMNFKKTESRTYNIASVNNECEGYSAVINNKDVYKLLDLFYDKEQNNSSMLENILNKYIPDNDGKTELKIYLNKNAMAGIDIIPDSADNTLSVALDVLSDKEIFAITSGNIEKQETELQYDTNNKELLINNKTSEGSMKVAVKDNGSYKTFVISNLNSIMNIANKLDIFNSDSKVSQYVAIIFNDLLESSDLKIKADVYSGAEIKNIYE